MTYKNLLFPALILSTTTLYAANHILVIGGGGEPVGTSTNFDRRIGQLGKNVQEANWKYEISFNGGHSTTEQILRTNYPSPVAPVTDFTVEEYNRLLKDYKNKILSGKIKAGDQLMILTSSHGSAQAKGMVTHSISAKGGPITDYNSLKGSATVNLDHLAEIVKLTNERGIKLAIVDLSCHSGNTMALKKNAPNTCIITSTGPIHYGFSGQSAFTEKFIQNLKAGTNLEEAFLKGRIQSSDPSYPMISTEANDQIVKDVYESITPYLYYTDAKSDKLANYIVETANADLICKRENEFKKLISQIEKLQSVVTSTPNGFNAEALKDLLKNYKESQDQVLKASLAMGAYNLSKKEVFTLPANTKAIIGFKLEYNWKELLELDIEKRIADYEKFKKFSSSSTAKADNQAAIDFLKIVNEKKQSIIRQHPKLKNFKENVTSLVTGMNNSRKIAAQVALQERQFYEELYRRKQNNQSNNPCREIVF